MIEQLTDLPAGVLGFHLSGTITEADYTTVLVPRITQALEAGDVRVMCVLDEGIQHMSPGAIWEDVKFGIKRWSGWKKIALVTDSKGLRDAAGAFAWLMPGEVRTFPLAERDSAVSWLAG